MSFVNKLLEKIIPKKVDETGAPILAPVLSESIERSSVYNANYNGWIESKAYIPTVTLVRNAYEFKKIGTDFHVNLHIFNSKHSNGFYFTFNESFGKDEFTFLFDFLKNRVLGLNYYLYTSKREISERPNHIHEVEMHYLKPKRSRVPTDKKHQEYGNVLIEHVKIDDVSSYIKLMAHVYTDSNFEHPKDFNRLTDYLFRTTGITQ